MISSDKKQLDKGMQVFPVQHVARDHFVDASDQVIKEAPLEITLAYGKQGQRKKELIAVTMRTPGDDFNMVTGWLFNEHIIHQAADILAIRFTGNYAEAALQENAVLVELAPDLQVDFSNGKKFVTNSACGFCGNASFDIAAHAGLLIPIAGDTKISLETLHRLPAAIQNLQGLFASTGGSHAVALFSFDGLLLKSAEDVGRHNAMDKLIGTMIKQQALPFSDCIAMFSGRLSYELVQKSLAAGIPVLASIGAPTSLALELAGDYNMTVVGFLKSDRLNIYCGSERIAHLKTHHPV